MPPRKHIIIFSHGFGVRKDDRGLFTDIASSLKDVESIMFDYNDIDENRKELTVKKFSEQVPILKDIINKTKFSNPESIIDIICHSQGSLITALTKPTGIRKIILIAPPFDTDIDRMLNVFRPREGTEINKNGISKLARRDGSKTIITQEYWNERNNVNPIDVYLELAKQTELTIINAIQDEILSEKSPTNLENIKIINLNGSHDFNGEYRKNLINTIENIINS
jgi:hypothetical protein